MMIHVMDIASLSLTLYSHLYLRVISIARILDMHIYAIYVIVKDL